MKPLSRYELNDICNANEFGLLYLLKKILHMKGEKCSGGKHSKVRLARMQCLVKPRCFKNVKSLPCHYRSLEESWMKSFLFHEWVKELDKTFKKENRKVVLIVDNCPAHPITEGLRAVELVFLPPNITSKTQPMNQGVIHPLKAK